MQVKFRALYLQKVVVYRGLYHHQHQRETSGASSQCIEPIALT